MPELQKRLEKLLLRLDYMGLRVQQAVADAIQAVKQGNLQAAQDIDEGDTAIDREEVEIEQECIRLLALYQPAAVDLRTICTIIKLNTDLERIADKAVSIAHRTKHVVAEQIRLDDDRGFNDLAHTTSDVLNKTIRMISTIDVATAHDIIKSDPRINDAYRHFVESVLTRERQHVGGAEIALTLIMLARALERVADLCKNIAEDIIFLRTGDIVRHTQPLEPK
jgi:phosphate transport system protein